MISTFIFILGSFVGKSIPLVFGLFLINVYDETTYNVFLQLMVYSNLLVAVSTVSYSPLILMANKEVYGDICRQAMNFSVIVTVVGGMAILFTHAADNSLELSSVSLFVFLYSLGLCMAMIVIAKANSELQHNTAGKILLLVMVGPYIVVVGLSQFFFLQPHAIYFLLALVSFFIGSVVFLKYVRLKDVTLLSIAKSIPREFNHVCLLIYSAGIMFSRYYLILVAGYSKESSIELVVLGLGFQLVSIITFLPGALGNIILPRLLNINTSTESRSYFIRIFLFYIVLSICIASVFYFLSSYIFNYYGIENDTNTQLILGYMFASACIASIGALVVQYLISYKKYINIAFSSVLFALIMIVTPNYLGQGIADLASFFLFAYVVVLIVNVVGLLSHWKILKNG